MCQWQRRASADGVTINTEINSRFTETGTTEDKNEKKTNELRHPLCPFAIPWIFISISSAVIYSHCRSKFHSIINISVLLFFFFFLSLVRLSLHTVRCIRSAVFNSISILAFDNWTAFIKVWFSHCVRNELLLKNRFNLFIRTAADILILVIHEE